MNDNDGGPAFPEHGRRTSEFGTISRGRGVTVRDYFAAAALHQFPLTKNPMKTTLDDAEDRASIAHDCYAMADAMLAEREK